VKIFSLCLQWDSLECKIVNCVWLTCCLGRVQWFVPCEHLLTTLHHGMHPKIYTNLPPSVFTGRTDHGLFFMEIAFFKI